MKNKMRIWIGCGMACIVLLLISSWYAVAFNDARLVKPMDLGSYTFKAQDLPMILSISLSCAYIFALFVQLLLSIKKNSKRVAATNTTRKLNPRLGLLGLLGFLGFAGLWTYAVDGSIFPFAFFLFFGFFGFYYEGKMSGTFMDERFRENAIRARLKASDISFSILFIALVILCQGKLTGNHEFTLIAIVVTLSLALALRIFLAEYLLYRYDHDGQAEESED